MEYKKRALHLQILSGIITILALYFLNYFKENNDFISERYSFPESVLSGEIDSLTTYPLQDAFENYQLVFRYPAKPWFGDSVVLRLDLEKKDGNQISESEAAELTALILRTSLEMESVEVIPGNTILMVIKASQKNYNQWELKALESSIPQGRIWVSMLTVEGEKINDPYAPIFVLPVDIELRSVWGLKVGLWRAFFTIIGLAGSGLFILARVQNRKHKRN